MILPKVTCQWPNILARYARHFFCDMHDDPNSNANGATLADSKRLPAGKLLEVVAFETGCLSTPAYWETGFFSTNRACAT